MLSDSIPMFISCESGEKETVKLSRVKSIQLYQCGGVAFLGHVKSFGTALPLEQRLFQIERNVSSVGYAMPAK